MAMATFQRLHDDAILNGLALHNHAVFLCDQLSD